MSTMTRREAERILSAQEAYEAIARHDRRTVIAAVGGRTVTTATQDEQETANENEIEAAQQ